MLSNSNVSGSFEAPQRLRSFLWLAANEALLANYNSLRRGLTDVAVCPLCEIHEKTVLHILRDCRVAKEMWMSVVIKHKSRGCFLS